MDPRSARTLLGGPLGRFRGSLAVSALLALGVVFMATGTTLGISGTGASVGSAVQAQYPDATSLAPPPGAADPPAVARLSDIGREADADVAQERAAVELRPKVFSAVAEGAAAIGIDENVRGYGSIALLLSGMFVLAVGGVLRFQRRPMQT
ncbi:MAG TPA: hypothetical protein VK631_01240 [Solirubrobacteraceae bacterium]|nr:hypothetical protein [Solirubrobacteraceae bacterium]